MNVLQPGCPCCEPQLYNYVAVSTDGFNQTGAPLDDHFGNYSVPLWVDALNTEAGNQLVLGGAFAQPEGWRVYFIYYDATPNENVFGYINTVTREITELARLESAFTDTSKPHRFVSFRMEDENTAHCIARTYLGVGYFYGAFNSGSWNPVNKLNGNSGEPWEEFGLANTNITPKGYHFGLYSPERFDVPRELWLYRAGQRQSKFPSYTMASPAHNGPYDYQIAGALLEFDDVRYLAPITIDLYKETANGYLAGYGESSIAIASPFIAKPGTGGPLLPSDLGGPVLPAITELDGVTEVASLGEENDPITGLPGPPGRVIEGCIDDSAGGAVLFTQMGGLPVPGGGGFVTDVRSQHGHFWRPPRETTRSMGAAFSRTPGNMLVSGRWPYVIHENLVSLPSR